MLRIDAGSHMPIYQQIVDGLRSAIAAGTFGPGEMLPSQRELAIQVKVNPNTVQRAFEILEREGLIHALRGRGMFVTNRASHNARSGAEANVRRALQDAVRRGRAAGVGPERLQELFDAVIDDRHVVKRAAR